MRKFDIHTCRYALMRIMLMRYALICTIPQYKGDSCVIFSGAHSRTEFQRGSIVVSRAP